MEIHILIGETRAKKNKLCTCYPLKCGRAHVHRNHIIIISNVQWQNANTEEKHEIYERNCI